MKRRDFLRSATQALIVLPFGTFLVSACGDDETVVVVEPTEPPPGDDTPPDAPPRVEGTSIVYTSSRDEGHAHTFSIALADLLVLPASDIPGNTSVAEQHVHRVLIRLADLQRALEGQTVKVTTGVTNGHAHVFTIVRID